DKTYLEFGNAFERRFLSQGEHEDRGIEQTLDLGWEVLSMLPRDELHRLSDDLLDKHYRQEAGAEVRRESEEEGGVEGGEPATNEDEQGMSEDAR
ncbi:MAG: hypothetical protein AMK72_05300, partial [Planctomycetes bacterium SM23_25]